MSNAAELESRRFRQKVQRFWFDRVDHSAIEDIRLADADLAIIRIPSSELGKISRFSFSGATPLVTDTLVYYGCQLADVPILQARNPGLDFVRLKPDHRRELEHLVRAAFRDYKNHYTANPYLPPEAALEGYVEWGASFLEESSSKLSWIVFDDGVPVAFANCVATGEVLEIVLNGVHPDASGAGIYGDLITHVQSYGRENGYKRIVVSTQIENRPVQRAWVRRGFQLQWSLNTIHLNLFMSDMSRVPPFRKRASITAELVESFGKMVGDLNPVHFDRASAVSLGYEDRLAHEALINGLISGALGNHLPGRGTIYMEQNGSYLSPVYIGDDLSIKILIKHMDLNSGQIIASTRAYTDRGGLSYCGQATLLNREFVERHSA